jgi:hypothetical protein
MSNSSYENKLTGHIISFCWVKSKTADYDLYLISGCTRTENNYFLIHGYNLTMGSKDDNIHWLSHEELEKFLSVGEIFLPDDDNIKIKLIA